MKKTAITIMIGLMLPVTGFAQSISTTQINQLLQEDLTSLIAINGRVAVQNYLTNILFLLQSQTAFGNTQTGFNTGVTSSTSANSGSNRGDDVDVRTLSARDVEDESAELRGEVTEGRNVEVWFAISSSDSTPSCSSSSQRERVSGDYDEDDTFDKELDDLRENRTYYFRACAEDEDGDDVSGSVRSFRTGDDNNNDDEPDVDTDEARDIEDDSAELRGSVDMNDFKNGVVFFVWGEDEDQVEDATDEDEYADIDEDGDDLQKERVDSDLDGDEDYDLDIRNLDDDTDYYFVLCVEYEDEDETLECGSIEEFETDN